mmetsp:Transcript_19316/g.30213  ORF Transcript_19316/g.30213 Transcript_19316/m.30213 type:complete len:573 (+) Transcript_19316:87-1805(+)|eukprot:CAMPEP_0201724776 /NCGR_PEP_ID=MMETSP0593-20130828/8405_1 /ASSEMBLY_ACC=CAM_ASM_000672 /TAXON_ID=267983 /ORGANISM="Skeletonema japonicum, Strain CCMP2506" /LENGTH=572 /DNA_ID=CAMNT_0048216077 /DNA_START=13 /DNA_END=1731 /DNA_ORIENTATION=+
MTMSPEESRIDTSPSIMSSDDESPNGVENDLSNSMESSMQPRLLVHPENSVAYVTVSDPVQVNEGIAGRKFTMYRVNYDPPPPPADGSSQNFHAILSYATSVNRRYSDFSWLYERLHKERPGAIVPPLPDKQSVSRFSEVFIEGRRFHLEIFLRRVVCNPELKDTECLLVFLGGGDDEFKKAKKDGNFGSSKTNVEAPAPVDAEEPYQPFDPEMVPGAHYNSQHDYNKLIDKVEEELSTKKAGIKKWIKERKTSLKGTMVRSPDDAIFDEISNYISALEMGLKRIDTQTSSLIRRDKDVSTCMLEFGLGCDALCHIDDEINGVISEEDDTTASTGIGQTFRQMGKTADEISKLSYEYYEKELSCFREPLRDHLKMIHAVKIALQKRHNRRVTFSTCINSVESKKASVHKYKITPGKEGKSLDAAASLARAEATLVVAKQNYEECSQRALREIDRFRKENAACMYATMLEFAKVQKEHHDKMNSAWGALVPQLEGLDASDSALRGKSFVEASAAASKNNPTVDFDVEAITTDVQNMAMPSYPPPPEPTSNGLESSVLNEAVRYRTVDSLPSEE